MMAGFAGYLTVVLLAAFLHLLSLISGRSIDLGLRDILWYTGMPVFAGLLLCVWELTVLLPRRRQPRLVSFHKPDDQQLTVLLTAFNDERSIPLAVADFRSHPLVRRVIVVDNNSSDRTVQAARDAGAETIVETAPGYGRCVYRALSEAIRHQDTQLTVLCEGDMTFRASDLDKFMAYIPHAEIVNGTRIVEQLRESETQLTTFMYYGNFFVGKLLEAKHLGQGTFTDVGTTYKMCRTLALRTLVPLLNPSVNLEFNAHFMDVALTHAIPMVECPITFHRRVGASKGGNTSNARAFNVGLRMIVGITLAW
jgi:glycosyltransferase involved in cell wall biosynthesis